MAISKVNGFLNKVYPVGSIYMSVNSTSPATLFGGTWERITGRFLLGATDSGTSGTAVLKTASVKAGSTGGEAAHTLTVAETPAHEHSTKEANGTTGTLWYLSSKQAGGFNWTGQISSTGGGGSHNTMPPFLSVYIWKRTA